MAPQPSTPNSETYGNSQTNRHRSTVVASAGMNIDKTILRDVTNDIDKMKKKIDELTKSAKQFADEMQRGAGTMSGSAATARAQNGMPLAPAAPPSRAKGVSDVLGEADAQAARRAAGVGGFATGVGGVRGLASSLGGPSALGTFMGAGYLAQAVGAMDNRIQRGAQYAASADRLSVMLQQQYGKSQQQVMAEMRQPLAALRLGMGGVNDILAYQSSIGGSMTGSSLAQFGQSIAGIRALSGYSKSTADVLNDQRALTDPQTVNRMQSMLGVSAFRFGGEMRDPMELRQSIVRSMGITGQAARAGLAPGSRLRSRLSDAGVPVEMQEEILRYAMQNDQFRAAGGRGMFDPRKESHRSLMGIEGNFATQMEITDQKRTMREENFMERQIDNFAQMEKNTQTMVELLGHIDEVLSGVYGVRASTGGWMKLGGRILQGAGIATALIPGGQGIGLGMMAAGTVMSGDPVDATGSGGNVSVGGTSDSSRDSQIMAPFGYKGSGSGPPAPLSKIKEAGNFKKLDSRLQDRLLRLFRDHPTIGFGGGWRDPAQQEAMFRDRYVPDPNGTVEWNGQRWKRVKGAAAAPPGRSMHEVGLAADLVGDMRLLQEVAGRYGLKTFAHVNNEPWHVQLIELPNSRREWEKGGGAPSSEVPTMDGATIGNSPMATPSSSEEGSEHAGWGPSSAMFGLLGQMSISDALGATRFSGGFTGGAGWGNGTGTGSSAESTLASGGTIAGSGAALAARAAYQAGFRGEDLFKIVAIAGRESGWNPTAVNQSSRDTGMWQIAPMNWAPYTQEQLLDPFNNAKVAFRLFQSSGFHGWKATSSRMKNEKGTWVVDPTGKSTSKGWAANGDEMWNTEAHKPEALAAVSPYMSGDPMPPVHHGRGGGGSVSIGGSTYTITIAPRIEVVGASTSEGDLRRIAQRVAELTKSELEKLELRSS